MKSMVWKDIVNLIFIAIFVFGNIIEYLIYRSFPLIVNHLLILIQVILIVAMGISKRWLKTPINSKFYEKF